jgi:hypothetical protein
MTSRIYAVHIPDTNSLHLVEASSKAAALRHVATQFISVEVPSQHDLIAAIKGGVEVEKAGADEAKG